MTPARRLEQTNVETRLAQWRVKRGMTQKEMWESTGMGRSTYLKLEHKGGFDSPPLRYLANCAIVLGCKLEDLVEPTWRTWGPFDSEHPEPEDPSRLWHGGAAPPVDTEARDAKRAWLER